MSTSVDPASWAGMSRLLRRTGFGATGDEIDAAVKLGPQKYLAAMLAADPEADPGAVSTPAPAFAAIAPLAKDADKATRQARNQQIAAQMASLTGWWIKRMATVQQPFGEKLTFVWHNHFSTSASKVRKASYMLAQNEKLRKLGRGNFRDLAYAMLTDAAMLLWLDGQQNTKGAPNENLSREFMELFALGHGDGYTETDVREGAVALTGWRINPDGSTAVRPTLHDDGQKVVLGVTGDLDVGGFCDAVLAQPNASRYLATRTYGQIVSDQAPTAATVSALTAAYGADRNLSRMLTAMLAGPDFSTAVATSVSTPVEWLLGSVRALKVPTSDANVKKMLQVLRTLGQLPFYPPNVGGWPDGTAFLSTAAADARMKTAAVLVTSADLGPVSRASASGRIDAVRYLLGVPTWSDRSLAALKNAAGDPRTLTAVALNTPEYLVA